MIKLSEMQRKDSSQRQREIWIYKGKEYIQQTNFYHPVKYIGHSQVFIRVDGERRPITYVDWLGRQTERINQQKGCRSMVVVDDVSKKHNGHVALFTYTPTTEALP